MYGRLEHVLARCEPDEQVHPFNYVLVLTTRVGPSVFGKIGLEKCKPMGIATLEASPLPIGYEVRPWTLPSQLRQ